MKPKQAILQSLALAAFMLPLLSGNAFADTAAESVVRGFYAQLEAAMKQGDRLGYAGRYKKLDPVIRTAFDMPLMAKMSVGSVWSSASPQEQQQLIAAFTDFSVASYASQFASDAGEKFSIVDEKPVANNSVIVETRVTPQNGGPVAMNYLMKQDSQGHYRIVDVFLNGAISQLATRRAEFSSIAREDGISALATSLEQKSKEMGPS